MGMKYSTTTADYLEWEIAMNLIRKLAKDENYKMSLLIAIGCFTGLRISDILSLRWNQILNTDEFSIIEKKEPQISTAELLLSTCINLHILKSHPIQMIFPVPASMQQFLPDYTPSEALPSLQWNALLPSTPYM